MAYWIAKTVGGEYVFDAEQFSVRSNAEKYAKRRGWKSYVIVTDEQRKHIENGGEADVQPPKKQKRSAS